MDKRFKWNMFVTSFLPLWISIIISNVIDIIILAVELWITEEKVVSNLTVIIKHSIVSIVAIVVVFIISLISVISINGFIKDKRRNPNKPQINVKKAERANSLSSEFLLAYILPMIAFDFTELKDVILFVIYFLTLAFLCIRNNNVYTNILLEFKGYRMYTCDLEGKVMGRDYLYKDSLVISKENLTVHIDNRIEYWDFDNFVYIDLR